MPKTARADLSVLAPLCLTLPGVTDRGTRRVYAIGDTRLLGPATRFIVPNSDSEADMTNLQQRIEDAVLAGAVVVVNHVDPCKSSILGGRVPLRWGTSRILILREGDFRTVLAGSEPHRHWALWRHAFDPKADLAVCGSPAKFLACLSMGSIIAGPNPHYGAVVK